MRSFQHATTNRFGYPFRRAIFSLPRGQADKPSPTLQIPWCANRCNLDKLLVKISKSIGRIKNNLTVDAANKVHQSLVLPVNVMDYCDVAAMGKNT